MNSDGNVSDNDVPAISTENHAIVLPADNPPPYNDNPPALPADNNIQVIHSSSGNGRKINP